jgi:hypothetical protein
MPIETDIAVRRAHPVPPERIRAGRGTHVEMRMQPLPDNDWTDRIPAGRANELDNLDRLVAS